jgi:hypothetical protein
MLSEFYLKFVSQKEIKGKYLTIHLVEAPSLDTTKLNSFLDEFVLPLDMDNTWKLYFDGTHYKKGSSIGVILLPPLKRTIPLCYHIYFVCNINIIEYEVLIVDITMNLSHNVQHL